MLLYWTHWFCW